MSCLREVQTISKSAHILPMPSLTRLTSGGVLNPLKNTTKIGHNKLLHQEPLQPPLEPRQPAATILATMPTDAALENAWYHACQTHQATGTIPGWGDAICFNELHHTTPYHNTWD